MRSAQRRRHALARESGNRCGYCQTQEIVSGVPLTIEHIVPSAKGGSDGDSNLWLSCRLCNEAKGVQTAGPDPLSGELVSLFNPRLHTWNDHFAWSEDGTVVIGRTPVGRATVEALRLNSELHLHARALWVEAGWHPPKP